MINFPALKTIMKRIKCNYGENKRQVRLSLLENAITNYGGGIYSLQKRVDKLSNQNQYEEGELTAFLKDVSQYLRDVAMYIDSDL